MPRLIVLLVVWAAMATAPPAVACGAKTDCTIGERSYRIALPEGEGPYGALVYMHGYRGTAAAVMENSGLRQMARDLGVALIAPKSGGEDWLLRHAPRKGFTDDSRELAFFDAMLDDALARHPIDPERLVATGFSAGGMMTWTLACYRADRFAAFVPVAGTFWAPIPKTCNAAPVRLIHIHGTMDRVVPIEGRPIADTHQGDARAAMARFAAAGDYAGAAPLSSAPDDLACTAREGRDVSRLVFCTHDGGHVLRPDWLSWAWNTLAEPS